MSLSTVRNETVPGIAVPVRSRLRKSRVKPVGLSGLVAASCNPLEDLIVIHAPKRGRTDNGISFLRACLEFRYGEGSPRSGPFADCTKANVLRPLFSSSSRAFGDASIERPSSLNDHDFAHRLFGHPPERILPPVFQNKRNGIRQAVKGTGNIAPLPVRSRYFGAIGVCSRNGNNSTLSHKFRYCMRLGWSSSVRNDLSLPFSTSSFCRQI